ncbi:WD40 repeat-like protein [Mytilinidion resinicola]|uniref:WD40 repeat-like protein n=1 Tax=Mytilinidion resinicola TaxID=574789 RepID=A0A6A6Z3T7_9PEZI|nr:WD40 repeat-like protein [Mytilinidion resinicola]KAF2815690.1 WD40 repeat-like protein [Mytilinidion resinicola]
MRLDSETTKRSQSPSQTYSNGSTRSPGSRVSLGKIANGNSHVKSESNGSAASYTNGNALSNGRPPQLAPSFYGHDRGELTRILIQSLTDLGYHGAAGALSQESGFEVEGPTVAAFRSAVLQGDWAEAEALLFGTHSYDSGGGVGLRSGGAAFGNKSHGKAPRTSSWSPSRQTGGLTLAEGANENEMKFWMRQQKYLELLETRDLGSALMVLRQELTPLHQDEGRLHALSSLMMCQSADDLKYQAQWDGAGGESRSILLSELSKSISPSVMIPEHRLAILLDQLKDSWISNCLYHNTATPPSLYVDHTCERDDLPLKTVLELRHHTDEVWFLRFSHDGTKLATTSKDATVIIYETTTYKILHRLTAHESGVCYVAWSPDDSKLITCAQAQDNTARIWDTKSGRLLTTITEFSYPVTSAAWAPNGESFVVGSQDTAHGLCLWNVQGDKLYEWTEGSLRVHDLAVSPDGQRLVVLLEHRILVYDFVTREKLCEWALDDVKLTSVNISQDSRHMLISMNDNKIRLMDIDTGDVRQTFTGQTQTIYIIRSSFGGANENFVVSGSEDSRVYIWRTNGHLVEKLDAHPGGCVNAVAWHPTDPRVFASAGDDKKVRIWKPSPSQLPSSSNGYGR